MQSGKEEEGPPSELLCSDRQRWSRLEVVEKLDEYLTTAGEGGERSRAVQVDVPRSTIRRWQRQASADDDEQGQFFGSSIGLQLLQRLMLALTVVFEVPGTDGLRKLAQFLELSGLSPYVANSRGWLHKFSLATMEQMVAFETHVMGQLKVGLKTKLRITLCLDETFHPQVCLVAMEPVSGFIFVERYANKRDAETWLAALQSGLVGLEIEVVQATSDEGKAILHVVEEELHAHHSPDVFHVQHEMAKGTTSALSAQERAAKKAVLVATAQMPMCLGAQGLAEPQPRKSDDPAVVDPDGPAVQTQTTQDRAEAKLQEATTNRTKMQGAIRGVGDAYHPYDLETGVVRSGSLLAQALLALLATARAVVVSARLSLRCVNAVEKAGRVMADMVGTLKFFHRVVAEHVATLPVGPAVQAVVLTLLIPALYLQRAAAKACTAKRREAINQVARRLLIELQANQVWLALDESSRDLTVKSATWCANLFQRSSSCVEGRNGQLSLCHHALHRLSEAKLHGLTILHNFFLRRADGTTAATRLFSAPHEDMFEWVLSRVPMPPRPAPHNARVRNNTRRKFQASAMHELTVPVEAAVAA